MTVVQKYGGSSVAGIERLRAVAQRVAATRRRADRVVVVVSAMGDTTDELTALAHQLDNDPPSREMDMLLSTGETVTAPLLAMALHARGVDAVSLTGMQAGIRTSGAHRSARITDIVPERVIDQLAAGRVVIVAGFQGATDQLDITTLGRGGSDTTAVALAVALHAHECEIFTDVTGIHSADPRVVSDARPMAEIGYDEMLELASAGATVMHPRAVEIGEAYSMPIRVRSAFTESPGTLIHRQQDMEDRPKVRGIAHETDVAKVTLLGVPDRPGIAAAVFGPLGEAHINIDIVVQNVSHSGHTDLSFTLAESELARAQAVLERVVGEVGADGYDADRDIAKVTVVGSGILGAPGVFARICEALAEQAINIRMISTGEIRVTCIIDRARVEDAVRALHRAFELELL
ncbi:MAG: aspartate kinase [Candidatus Dormibacteraeota bacterium]|uniref:Aspartokinase n=2 Tax=Candidatus Aeolococcus gillhamiae TaxID=3127015 RepID=A0A934JTN9_9BACT|nr:aspartate kinase [Candidatus Dormibacteraeota bacterium]